MRKCRSIDLTIEDAISLLALAVLDISPVLGIGFHVLQPIRVCLLVKQLGELGLVDIVGGDEFVLGRKVDRLYVGGHDGKMETKSGMCGEKVGVEMRVNKICEPKK